jgi:eukaryotic-like serine/threonine-protein kinase
VETELQEYLQGELGYAYVVERELGGGGMSRVFLAVERSLGRRVVIKVLPPELFSGVSEARFQREILVTANLQHPHIVPVLSAGAHGDLHYYVTPFVEGRSLRERLALDGALPVADALAILREVAGALAYAHTRGVIHRDVKPENVLLSGGHAVLADFGIARAVEEAARGERLTGAGHGIGTPGYMAPEQLAGDPTVDARADVFALGVVGYEMLAGRPPFTGATPHALATAYFTELPRPLRDVRPDTPPVVANAIMRALARAPAERFATAAELCDALMPASDATRRRRRRAVRLTLAAAAVAGLVLGGVLGRGFGPRPSGAEPPGRRTLAVLPFKNLGPPEDAYFADGVTEELTSRLAGLAGLSVISRTSADQYRNSPKPLREIARELNAEYVLEGSVRWERTANGRGRVRVTPQLIRVRDDSHLWAERYDAELSDVFGVQSRIAEAVVSALAVTLADPERQRMDARPTENLAAYDSYMRGERMLTREATTPAALTRATALLTEATGADPRFALAFAKLGMAHRMMYENFIDRSPERLGRARAAIDSALALDPSLPDAHLALGDHMERDGDLERASAEFAIAERARPNDSEILARTGELLAHRGRWAEGVARLRRAADLDPRSVEVNMVAARGCQYTRDYAAAMKYIERAMSADPDAIHPYVMKAQVQMMLAGDRGRARQTARELVLKFGAERVAAAEGFDALISVLDPADLATVEHASISAFDGNALLYYFWRFELFQDWQPERARAYADSVLVVAQELTSHEKDYHIHAALGWLSAAQGRSSDAVREARRSLELMPRSRDAVLWTDAALLAANTFLRAGHPEAAIDQLEQLLSVPSLVTVPYLRTDPLWARLRGHPRFERLLARSS